MLGWVWVRKKMERFEEWKKRRGKKEHRGRRTWRLTYLSRAYEGNWGNWGGWCVCLSVCLLGRFGVFAPPIAADRPPEVHWE